jgi:CRP/FNR family transcriptional regulator
MSSTLKDGRRQVVGFASAGDYVGLISTRQHAFEARTTTATQIRCAPISMLRRWASEEPSVADDLHEAIGREFARLQAHFLTIGRLDATGRVATFLLMLADKSERKDSGPIEVHVPMLRNDIADFLCISVETVSRTLTELKNMKMIALNGCRIVTLTDRRALAQLTYALSRTTAP